MTATQIYDGSISGALIVSAIGTVSGASLLAIPYANGMKVVIVQTGGQ